MAKYCNICGTKMGNKEKFCPKCGAPYTAPPQMANTNKPIQKKNNDNKKTIIIAIIAGVIILITFVVGILLISGAIGQGSDNKKGDSNESSAITNSNVNIIAEEEEPYVADPELNSPYSIENFDAETYFKENSTILSVTETFSSDKVHTESEAYDDLYSRGFVEDILTPYSQNGEYYESPRYISYYSDDKYPIYQTYYITSSNVYWAILDIDGAIMAVTSNGDDKPPIILSETDSLVSYDSVTNKFYQTKPNASEVTLKVISHIDSETLEEFQVGGI